MERIPLTAFSPLIRLLAGKRVFVARPPGNVGDKLIYFGTLQLFTRLGVELCDENKPAQLYCYAGGGNLGSAYMHLCQPVWDRLRHLAKKHAGKIVVLPQSWYDDPSRPSPRPWSVPDAEAVFAREEVTYNNMPGSVLVPDLALLTNIDWKLPSVEQSVGLWLRRDREGLFASSAQAKDSCGDPALRALDARSYINLAAKYAHVITDRLHFAIAAMLAGRRATLLPGNYHKNQAMWQTWLHDLGCEWAETPEEALRRR